MARYQEFHFFIFHKMSLLGYEIFKDVKARFQILEKVYIQIKFIHIWHSQDKSCPLNTWTWTLTIGWFIMYNIPGMCQKLWNFDHILGLIVKQRRNTVRFQIWQFYMDADMFTKYCGYLFWFSVFVYNHSLFEGSVAIFKTTTLYFLDIYFNTLTLSWFTCGWISCLLFWHSSRKKLQTVHLG